MGSLGIVPTSPASICYQWQCCTYSHKTKNAYTRILKYFPSHTFFSTQAILWMHTYTLDIFLLKETLILISFITFFYSFLNYFFTVSLVHCNTHTIFNDNIIIFTIWKKNNNNKKKRLLNQRVIDGCVWRIKWLWR